MRLPRRFAPRNDRLCRSLIDDALSEVFARFYEFEGTIPAMDSFKRYAKKYGLPMNLYVDRHTTYKSTRVASIEDELNDVRPMSQFERAMKELGVEVKHANLPQAKGRVERLFNTIQDRLPKEMRLQNIKTIEAGNEFLKRYFLSIIADFRLSLIQRKIFIERFPRQPSLTIFFASGLKDVYEIILQLYTTSNFIRFLIMCRQREFRLKS